MRSYITAAALAWQYVCRASRVVLRVLRIFERFGASAAKWRRPCGEEEGRIPIRQNIAKNAVGYIVGCGNIRDHCRSRVGIGVLLIFIRCIINIH